MKNKNLVNNLVVIIVFIGILIFSLKTLDDNTNINSVIIGGVDTKVEVVSTKEAQVKGLSGRESLAPDSGMLFVFNKPDQYYFWMKDMNFSIDIIWINSNKEIIYIKKDAQPENFLETYGPDEDSLYVLEVNAGFAEKNNIKVGDLVEFTF